MSFSTPLNTVCTAGFTVAVAFHTEQADTDGYHVVNDSIFTIPAGLGGIYTVSATVMFDGTANGIYGLLVNSNFFIAGSNIFGDEGPHTVSTTVAMSAGDTIALGVRNTSGTDFNAIVVAGSNAAVNTPRFAMFRIAA